MDGFGQIDWFCLFTLDHTKKKAASGALTNNFLLLDEQ